MNLSVRLMNDEWTQSWGRRNCMKLFIPAQEGAGNNHYIL